MRIDRRGNPNVQKMCAKLTKLTQDQENVKIYSEITLFIHNIYKNYNVTTGQERETSGASCGVRGKKQRVMASALDHVSRGASELSEEMSRERRGPGPGREVELEA